MQMKSDIVLVNSQSLVLFPRFPFEDTLIDTWSLGSETEVFRQKCSINCRYPTPSMFRPFVELLTHAADGYSDAKVNYAGISRPPIRRRDKPTLTTYSDFVPEGCSFSEFIERCNRSDQHISGLNMHLACNAWLLNEQREQVSRSIPDFFIVAFRVAEEGDDWFCYITIEMPCHSLVHENNDETLIKVLRSDPPIHDKLCELDTNFRQRISIAENKLFDGKRNWNRFGQSEKEELKSNVLRVTVRDCLPLCGNSELAEMNQPAYGRFIEALNGFTHLG
jgi:hypothetical protein